jgi:hypothetical protein
LPLKLSGHAFFIVKNYGSAKNICQNQQAGKRYNLYAATSVI